MSRLVTATALAIAAAACGPQATNGGRTSTEPPGKIAGKALLVGQVDHSLITVTAIGPITRAAAVDKEGGYLFDAVPPGVYLLSASAASTLEPSASGRVAVASAQTAVAPDLKLSPIGEVTGKVLVPSGSVLGVDVVVPGTSARTTADAAGQYHLRGVATGVQTVAALRTGLEPATTQVVVQYATSITAPDLAIKGIDAGSGVITGVARFFNRTDHSGIAVAIEGTTVTTKTAADGTYTLAEVPAGYLSLVATASPYQPSRIENILSVGRGTYRAPEMKLYLGQVKFQGTVSGASIRVGPSGHALFAGAAPGSTSYYLFFLAPTDTAQPTLLSTLPVTSSGVATQFSPDGRYAAFSVDGGLHIVSIATGNPVRLADGMTSLSQVKFSPDSKRLAFIGPAETNANGTVRPLMLIDLMQLLQTRVEEVRPAASGTYCSATYWPRRLQSFVYTPDG